MKLIKNLQIILYITAFFIGCDEYHSRNCPSFYFDYNSWGNIDNNDTINFLSSNNELISFVVQDKSFNEPGEQGYLGSGSRKDLSNSVVCKLSADILYYSKQLDLNLLINFNQDEAFEQVTEEQRVSLCYKFSKPNNEEVKAHYCFQISPLLNADKNVTILDSLTINNKLYQSVVKAEFDVRDTSLNINLFDKILSNKEDGVVYFRNLDGIEYFLDK